MATRCLCTMHKLKTSTDNCSSGQEAKLQAATPLARRTTIRTEQWNAKLTKPSYKLLSSPRFDSWLHPQLYQPSQPSQTSVQDNTQAVIKSRRSSHDVPENNQTNGQSQRREMLGKEHTGSVPSSALPVAMMNTAGQTLVFLARHTGQPGALHTPLSDI